MSHVSVVSASGILIIRCENDRYHDQATLPQETTRSLSTTKNFDGSDVQSVFYDRLLVVVTILNLCLDIRYLAP
jgi:hypothetical protein